VLVPLVQIGELSFELTVQISVELTVQISVAGDVARAATAGAVRSHRCDHCIENRRMLPHAEIIVRAPDCNLAVDAVIEGAWKPATAPFQVCEDPVDPSLRSPSRRCLKKLS
jgi:hypothetical protein